MANIFYDIREYGADPSGVKSSTKEINRAVEACHEAGGGTVAVCGGTFLTGAIKLLSNVNLFIDAGAVLSFSNDISEYPVIDTRWEGVDRKCYASCIYASDSENISVTGRGTLLGNGKFWWDIFKSGKIEFPRPKFISFDKCSNVLIEGITLKDSPSWTINPIRCENITVTKITIINPSDSPNTDGIDPDSCTNMRISDCHIDVGDDCIAVKAGTEDAREPLPCENIAITNCTMVHGHGGVVLGSEMSGGIRNIVISNCVFDGTDRGIRLKTRRGRGGVIEDVLVNNIFMKDVICPFVVNMYYFCGPRGKDPIVSDKNLQEVDAGTPAINNIRMSNIMAKNVHACAGFVYGLPESYARGININCMTVEMAKDAVPGVPAMMTGLDPMAKKGFYLANTQDSALLNVTVTGCEGDEFTFENVRNVTAKQG